MTLPIALTTGTIATVTTGTIAIKTAGTITETTTAGTMGVMTTVGITDAPSSRNHPIHTIAQISIGTVRRYSLRAITT